jgi:hypothetical protein
VEGRDGDLGAVLVDEAKPDAEHHDGSDDDPVGDITRGGRHARCAEQQNE